MNVTDLRQACLQAQLSKKTVDSNPFKQFKCWFDDALETQLLEPNAMILATVDENQQPTQRTVLLKYFDEKGFVFFTNYKSKKSEHIQSNNAVSLLFPWIGIKRQLAITGKVEKISSLESAKYFMSRPLGSQLGAWISHQSQVISSRSLLEAKMAEMKRKFSKGKVPVPDFWGGYRVVPDSMEFWQGRPNRLHDRVIYRLSGSAWKISMLSP